MRTPDLVELDRSIASAVDFLLGKQDIRGVFAGGCRARPLETALALHLLRLLGVANDAQVVLSDYCRRHVSGGTSGRESRAARLDDAVSRVLCKQVIHLPVAASELGALTLALALAELDHPTEARKRVLLRTLLVELDVPVPPMEPLPGGASRLGGNHLWARIALAAVRMLQMCAAGRKGEIDDDEIDFLVAHQAESGAWEQHMLTTLLALLALTRVGRGADTLRRGVEFVLRNLRPDGGIPFIPDQDVWNTCLAGRVLVEVGAPRARLELSARFLRAQQLGNGGFAYAAGVTQSDADDTAVGLDFLAHFDRQAFHGTISRAERNLLDLQNEDGGFPTFVRGAASDAEITAKAISALASRAGDHAGPIERAWAWLARNQRNDGGFRAEWKLCFTYPLLHVLAAAARRPAGSARDAVRDRGIAFLRRHRRGDGGWAIHPGDSESHVLGTAYALGGLSTVVGALSPREAFESATFLIERQSREGEIRASADSVGPRPFVYDVPLLSTIYALWGLSRVRRALQRSLLHEPSEIRS
jgi:squalene-hopene/tetraprenyl-beta-curcumene cyclase